MKDELSPETKEIVIAAMEKMYSILEGDYLRDWQIADIRNHYYKEFLDERRLRKKNEGAIRA